MQEGLPPQSFPCAPGQATCEPERVGHARDAKAQLGFHFAHQAEVSYLNANLEALGPCWMLRPWQDDTSQFRALRFDCAIMVLPLKHLA
mmetsp:Transcript_40851/g.97388  ORF Transcript_40851/g.97388 Transcript_40851/m.97388 type:complete len:89 (+) Transcript_40851:884-1150(+)